MRFSIQFIILLTLMPVLAMSQVLYVETLATVGFQNTPFSLVQVDPAGNQIALAGADRSVRIVDPYTLAVKTTFSLTTSKASSLSFNADGTLLATGMSDGQIAIWSPERNSLVKTLSHDFGVRSTCIDANGRLISGGVSKQIQLWDILSGQMLGKYPQLNSEVSALIFSQDGRFVIGGCLDGSVHIFGTNNFTLLKSSTEHRSAIIAIAMSKDGRLFATTSADSTIGIWNTETATLQQTIRNFNRPVTSLAFHSNGKLLAAAAQTLFFLDLNTGKVVKEINDTSFVALAVSSASRTPLFAITSKNGSVRTLRVLERKPDVTPPVIVMNRPKIKQGDTLRLYAPDVEIAGIITDESDFSELSMNASPLSVSTASPDERKGIDSTWNVRSFSMTIPLAVTGLNRFSITAIDALKNRASLVIDVLKLDKDSAVEIISPKETAEQDQILLAIEFKVWFDFLNYQIFLNTIEITRRENIPRKSIGTVITENISLSAGLNRIQLIVNGRNGEKIRKTLNITRRMLGIQVAASPEKTTKSQTGLPQRWAVIVGVSEYGNPTIKNLSYADRDAKAFAEFLKSDYGGGFQDERMKILLNKDATLQNVKQALFNFLRQTVDKDLVIIYFAGHGAPEPANPNNNYLLCYDTEPNSLETTAFPMWDINTALTRYIPSKRVVVFTDACHSGGISTEMATRGMGITENNLINQYLSDLSKAKEGIIVFTASQSGEVSQELDKFGHGVFTYFLLEGMKGEADLNNDYTVTVGELMDYVEEKVKRQTNGNQHPTRNQGSYDKDLTIALIPQ